MEVANILRYMQTQKKKILQEVNIDSLQVKYR